LTREVADFSAELTVGTAVVRAEFATPAAEPSEPRAPVAEPNEPKEPSDPSDPREPSESSGELIGSIVAVGPAAATFREGVVEPLVLERPRPPTAKAEAVSTPTPATPPATERTSFRASIRTSPCLEEGVLRHAREGQDGM
jgi:hypothetical protein